MVRVVVLFNTERKTVMVPESTVINDLMRQVGMDFSKGSINIDGIVLKETDLTKTLYEFDVEDHCTLAKVQKAVAA